MLASRKMGLSVRWRSTAERDLFMLLEADAAVKRWTALPEKVALALDGRHRFRIPSARVETASGILVLDAFDRIGSAESILVRALETAYGERGIRYRGVPARDIRLQPRWNNVQAILAARGFRTVPEMEFLLLAELSRSPVVRHTVASLEAALAGKKEVRQTVFALTLDNALRLDLSAPMPSAMGVRLGEWGQP